MVLDNDDPDEGDKDLLAKAQEELQKAIDKFKENHEKFAAKNGLILMDDKGIHREIHKADKVSNIQDSARFFGNEISTVLRITQEREKLSGAKWTGVFTKFLSKFYPLARLSLNVAGAVSSVGPSVVRHANYQGRHSFFSERGSWRVGDAIAGLSLNLTLTFKILYEENARPEDFFVQLERIQYQAERIVANPNFDVIPDSSRKLIQRKGIDLMTASVNFFNYALVYFSKGFGGIQSVKS
jgi:hypothetical protein